MKNISKTTPDIQVLIAADEDSPLKHITNVVDLCRNSGLENFRLQSSDFASLKEGIIFSFFLLQLSLDHVLTNYSFIGQC